jgi:hypothetical protein
MRLRDSIVRSVLLALPLVALVPVTAAAQGVDWRPPSAEMPMMPRAADLRNDWVAANSAWFAGVEAVSGVATSRLRASGDRRGGSDHVQIARFGQGPVPVVVWSDRNGDDRADMIEIFRSGGVIVQLIDANYNGRANVLRIYDEGGALVREERIEGR